MGPVKELVEQTGPLVQQQARTNIHLEAAAAALKAAADAYVQALEVKATEEEIEERAQALAEKILRRRRTPARRRSTTS